MVEITASGQLAVCSSKPMTSNQLAQQVAEYSKSYCKLSQVSSGQISTAEFQSCFQENMTKGARYAAELASH